jgi:hypothetical protein
MPKHETICFISKYNVLIGGFYLKSLNSFPPNTTKNILRKVQIKLLELSQEKVKSVKNRHKKYKIRHSRPQILNVMLQQVIQ